MGLGEDKNRESYILIIRSLKLFRFTSHKSTRQLLIFTIAMGVLTKPNHRAQLLFHMLGLSCLGGAIFLQLLVFIDILQRGYFMAVENNPAILSFETLLAAFSAIYFVYMYQRFIRSIKKE